jgi:hypothetical protein
VLDQRPHEQEWLSWAFFGLGTFTVFATVPLARTLQELVSEQFGRVYFLYFVVAGFAAILTMAGLSLWRRRLPVNAYLALIAVSGMFLAGLYSLREAPEEAVHYLEYGLLSVLAYRALVHRFGDSSVYLLSVLVAGCVGIADEWLQWVTPDRYWGFRDIRINLEAASLAQLGIALGLRPGIVSLGVSAFGIRWTAQLTGILLSMLALSCLNTPSRVEWYATRIPFLSFLLASDDVMIEYGYEYRHPEIGVFRSRLSPEELQETDASRGALVAQIINRYDSRESFEEFRRTYTASTAPYVHEVGIHLFRRDRLLERAELRAPSIWSQSHDYNVALRENRILELYFPQALRYSKHRWSDEKLAEVETGAASRSRYTSPVSNHLITRFSEPQLLAAFVSAIAAVLLLARWAGRGRPARSGAVPSRGPRP